MEPEITTPTAALRQPDTTETAVAFHAWPPGSVGRVLTADDQIRSWMTRKPCGCLAAADRESVVEYEGGEVSVRGPLACIHGKAWLQRGVWS